MLCISGVSGVRWVLSKTGQNEASQYLHVIAVTRASLPEACRAQPCADSGQNVLAIFCYYAPLFLKFRISVLHHLCLRNMIKPAG